jgi:cytoskeletal protein CcmA (bactofilin family)
MSKTLKTEHDLTGFLDQGTEFRGRLVFEGTFRINGKFQGDIITPHTLVIGENAEVRGNIQAGNVVINGRVIGKVKAEVGVEIQKPAHFVGEIQTPSLVVEDGVYFEAVSRMFQDDAPSSP